eukprot:748933-Hanusia_phi.AAC.5
MFAMCSVSKNSSWSPATSLTCLLTFGCLALQRLLFALATCHVVSFATCSPSFGVAESFSAAAAVALTDDDAPAEGAGVLAPGRTAGRETLSVERGASEARGTHRLSLRTASHVSPSSPQTNTEHIPRWRWRESELWSRSVLSLATWHCPP